MSQKLRVNSFFSGIGGFDLGFEQAGFKVVYQCEVDNFCHKILKKHWPNAKLDTDIKAVKAEDIPEAQIWCGGFPCQDVSVARGASGREGLRGRNSGLFFEFLSLVEANLPKVILIENVTGLLNSHKGQDFRIVLQSLSALGYGISWRVFNTRYFGAPQSRPRVYICAWLGNLSKAVFALHEFSESKRPGDSRKDFLTPEKCEETDATVPKVSYCLAATSGRHTGTDWSRSYVSYIDQVRRLTPTECEGLQGFPSNWSVPNGIEEKEELKDYDTLRYKALGNAVSVPVVKWIANRINQAFEDESLESSKDDNRQFELIFNRFKDFSTRKCRFQNFNHFLVPTLFGGETNQKIRWKNGGISVGELVLDCDVLPAPNTPISSRFIDLIEKRIVDDKYFLSANAATGILRRVNGQGRTLFGPLYDALFKLANSEPENGVTNGQLARSEKKQSTIDL